ncbi:MAG TPA: hypothetical protein VKB38_22075 [Terracidiphilus sp.]|nr:hypothetical protein [Terracidiphilus sp.]
MKKTLTTLLALASAALAAGAIYSMVSAPAEPSPDWRMHITNQQHALLIVPIDHAYRVSAYLITWAIQLGYVAWLAYRWKTQDK